MNGKILAVEGDPTLQETLAYNLNRQRDTPSEPQKMVKLPLN